VVNFNKTKFKGRINFKESIIFSYTIMTNEFLIK
jgi:hypothetical protein